MPFRKLTDAQVIEIRKQIATTPTKVLAERYKVTPQTIRNAARGVIPAYADSNAETAPAQPSGAHVGVEERRQRIMELLAEGVTQADIARQLGVSPALVNLVIAGER